MDENHSMLYVNTENKKLNCIELIVSNFECCEKCENVCQKILRLKTECLSEDFTIDFLFRRSITKGMKTVGEQADWTRLAMKISD